MIRIILGSILGLLIVGALVNILTDNMNLKRV